MSALHCKLHQHCPGLIFCMGREGSWRKKPGALPQAMRTTLGRGNNTPTLVPNVGQKDVSENGREGTSENPLLPKGNRKAGLGVVCHFNSLG